MEPPRDEPILEGATRPNGATPSGAAPNEATAPEDVVDASSEPGPPPTPPSYWQLPPDAGAGPDGGPARAGWRGAGSVVGRSFDVFGSALPLFLALAAPEAIFAAVSAYAGSNLAASAVATLMTFVTGLVVTAAMMFATDDLGRGVKPGLASALDRAAGRTVSLFLWALLLIGLFAGTLILPALGAFLATLAGAGTGAVLAFGVLFVVALVVAGFIGLRWALSSPAVVIGDLGPIAGLRRSWALTRGHVWGLVGLYFVLGLVLLLLTAGTSLLSVYAPDRAFAAVGIGIAVLVGSPLAAIALAIVYRDLDGRTEDMAAGVPIGRGRRTAVIATLGTGFLVFAAGIWAFSSAGGQVFDPDRGHVVAGTTQNPLSLCRPQNRKTTFESTDTIWVAAIFTKRVPAGGTIIVEYFFGDASLGTAPLTAGPVGLDCYYETQSLRGSAPGTYRITVTYASAVIADGRFTVR